MNYNDIKELSKGIEELDSSIPFSIIIYFSNIKKTLEPYLKQIEFLEKHIQTNEYKTFEEKRIECIKTHAKKKNGEVEFDENQNVKIENQIAFKEEITKLFSDNQEIVIEFENRKKLFEEKMKEEIDVNIPKLSIEDFPDSLMDKLDSFISIIEDY